MRTLEQLKAEMADRGLSDYFNAMAPFARNAVRITLDVREDDEIPVGASKFGGCPDLPGDVEWFQDRYGAYTFPQSFIAQINFAEVAPFDPDHKLPDHGMLYFFYDGDHDAMLAASGNSDWGGYTVHYYDGDLSAIARREPPADLGEPEKGELYGAARMCFDTVAEIPAEESALVKYAALPKDERQNRYWDWVAEVTPHRCNKLLGHADLIHGGVELICELIERRIPYTVPAVNEAVANGLDRNLERWTLMLQVDSNTDLGMMWSDMGLLYLWIDADDLANRRFDKTLVLRTSG